MKKDTLINLRVNKQLKEGFQAVAEREGYTMSDVLEACMIDVVGRNIVPINLKSKINRKCIPALSIPFIKKCLDEMIKKANNKKIKSVSLFGSHARGDAKPSSDVDFFLDVDEGYSLFDLAELQIGLEAALGRKVDLATKSDDAYFMNVIRKDAIKLYERSA